MRTKAISYGVTKMARNPKWTRDELILALDLYFRINPRSTNESHPEVIKLSNILNALPVHVKSEANETFRNPNGVFMKLANFMSCDPSYPGVGLSAGGKLDKEIWNEFSENREWLSCVAAAIINNYDNVEAPRSTEVESDLDDEGFPEGRVLARTHQGRERNQTLIKKKKAEVFKQTGKLACEACSFEFVIKYGEIGTGFAECHHNKPVSELRPGDKTKISDLAILCSNCHRMIHKARPWLSVQELRTVIK